MAAEHIKIHRAELAGNLENDAVDRDVIVYLPPSYATQKSRRYAVLYALHGYSIGAGAMVGEIHVAPDHRRRRLHALAALKQVDQGADASSGKGPSGRQPVLVQ